MRIRRDQAFQEIMRDVRRFDLVVIERKGIAAAHSSVKKWNHFRNEFAVHDFSTLSRDITSLLQSSYHDSWVPNEKRVLNDLQQKTNIFFSSALGADAIRALQHMQRVQAAIADIKQGR
ncbi:hypothetical protein N9D31_03200 [Oligoflexaceae bacterium]|nr:hypothetical protein [Oligoflexaceae bacterium]